MTQDDNDKIFELGAILHPASRATHPQGVRNQGSWVNLFIFVS